MQYKATIFKMLANTPGDRNRIQHQTESRPQTTPTALYIAYPAVDDKAYYSETGRGFNTRIS